MLFDRRRYRLELTPAGQLLVDEAVRLAEEVSRLSLRVRQVASGWEDRLWIVTDERLEFEPNMLYAGWRSTHQGQAMKWRLDQLQDRRLAERLVQGIDVLA